MRVANGVPDPEGDRTSAAGNTHRTVSQVSPDRTMWVGERSSTHVEEIHPAKARHRTQIDLQDALGTDMHVVVVRSGTEIHGVTLAGCHGVTGWTGLVLPMRGAWASPHINPQQGGNKMNNAESRSYLFQQDVVPDYPKCLMRGEWTTLYMKADEESARFESSSALAPLDKVPELLKNPDWDLKPELGGPEFLKTGVDLDAFYFEYGCRERMCPIIFLREFSGSYPQYFELAEDFRLYHNLGSVNTT